MSEHIAAEIWIGGKIPQSLVLQFCEAIRREGVSLEWGDAFFQPYAAENLLQARKADGREVPLLWLCDDEARWGQFDELEQFLQEHRISFTRRTEGRHDYGPELVEFRPEHGVVHLATNTEGHPVVVAERLSPIADLLSAAMELAENRSAVDRWSLVQTAQRLLRECLPPDLPSLEPFEIEPRAVAEPPRDSDAAQEGESAARRRWVLYSLNTDALLTTRVYDNYQEAADDASQVDDVLVLALTLNEVVMGPAESHSEEEENDDDETSSSEP